MGAQIDERKPNAPVSLAGQIKQDKCVSPSQVQPDKVSATRTHWYLNVVKDKRNKSRWQKNMHDLSFYPSVAMRFDTATAKAEYPILERDQGKG